MQDPRIPPREEEPSGAARVLIALLLGLFGLVTGFIAVSVFSDLPGVPLPRGAFLPVGIVTGAVCLVAGYRFSNKTLDILGEIWRVLWKLSLGILDIIRSLAR